jgi:hypothetical protein
VFHPPKVFRLEECPFAIKKGQGMLSKKETPKEIFAKLRTI